MESKFCFVFLLIFCTGVQSESIFVNAYNYVIDFGMSMTPQFMSVLECVGNEEAWGCAREKAGKMLDIWSKKIEDQQKIWEQEADAEVTTSGRSLDEMPSKVGRELTDSLNSLTSTLGRGLARAFERKKHDHDGGIDSITISTGGGQKKKMKKKQKPPKFHLIHVPMRKAQKEEKGRNFGNGVQSWVIGERSLPESVNSTPSARSVPGDIGRGVVADMWSMGQKALDTLAEHVVRNENLENGIQDRSSVEVSPLSGKKDQWQTVLQLIAQDLNTLAKQRGKKKKKKKAILKLLILGAVIKAKIATLLQILTYKLQVKFFIVALLSLAVNIARLWIDIKNKHTTQPQKVKFFILAVIGLAVNLVRLIIELKKKHKDEPQKDWRRNMILMDRQTMGEDNDPQMVLNPKKIIYYEHAQHQHHYDHEEEEPHGWGPWSRSLFPDEEIEVDGTENSPYRAQEKQPLIYNRPYEARS